MFTHPGRGGRQREDRGDGVRSLIDRYWQRKQSCSLRQADADRPPTPAPNHDLSRHLRPTKPPRTPCRPRRGLCKEDVKRQGATPAPSEVCPRRLEMCHCRTQPRRHGRSYGSALLHLPCCQRPTYSTSLPPTRLMGTRKSSRRSKLPLSLTLLPAPNWLPSRRSPSYSGRKGLQLGSQQVREFLQGSVLAQEDFGRRRGGSVANASA